MKSHNHFGSSLAIPSAVWKADGALLAGAPWSRGRAALFVEVRCPLTKRHNLICSIRGLHARSIRGITSLIMCRIYSLALYDFIIAEATDI